MNSFCLLVTCLLARSPTTLFAFTWYLHIKTSTFPRHVLFQLETHSRIKTFHDPNLHTILTTSRHQKRIYSPLVVGSLYSLRPWDIRRESTPTGCGVSTMRHQKRIYSPCSSSQIIITNCSNATEVAQWATPIVPVDPSQLRPIASETVDLIYWSLSPSLPGSPPGATFTLKVLATTECGSAWNRFRSI